MTAFPWQFDEFTACGVDYQDIAQVAVYDRRHQQFRDYRRQTQAILETLSLPDHAVVIDLGSGTGAFALHAASVCRTLHAVDISAVMLDYLRDRAASMGIGNIAYHHAGFLTYEHDPADPAHAIVSVAALHHLPDLWKQIALCRMAHWLAPGGVLYLADVVFDDQRPSPAGAVEHWIDTMAQVVAEDFIAEIHTHTAREFSTFHWVMTGMLERAGFVIDHIDSDSALTTYRCRLNPQPSRGPSAV